jgi:hypothetical protein
LANADNEPGIWIYKFTPSYYSNSNHAAATDVNLRANHGTNAAWLGYFNQHGGTATEFKQPRAGYEKEMQMPIGTLTSSIQYASGGFLGGSINSQIGDSEEFMLLGFGRTNLRQYYNLNFDPNDAITIGYAKRMPDKSLATVYYLWDDRLKTSQKSNAFCMA